MEFSVDTQTCVYKVAIRELFTKNTQLKSNRACDLQINTYVIYFFINLSVGAKYKGNRSEASKNRESKDFRFSPKFCGERTIEVLFKIKS